MKKYNFLFDQDGKQILYYDKNFDLGGDNNSVVGNKTFVIILWIGVFILVIIIGVLVYCLMKILKERKKMLYELEDEFDYIENSGDKNGNGKNNNFNFEGEEEGNKFGIN